MDYKPIVALVEAEKIFQKLVDEKKKGCANFVFMVDKEKGFAFQQQVKRIVEKYDWKPQPPRLLPKPKFVETIKETSEPKKREDKPWRQIW